MKSIRYAAVAILILMVAAVPGFAQLNNVKVTVPFEFQVGNQILPAGQYSFTQFAGPGLIIENAQGPGAAVALTSSVGGNSSEAKQPHLLFNKYGDKYFLVEAWLRYSDTGRKLPASPAEIEMARVASHDGTVMLAMK
jgi:hypothetical protein